MPQVKLQDLPKIPQWTTGKKGNNCFKISKHYTKDYKTTYKGKRWKKISLYRLELYAKDPDDRKSTSGYIILMNMDPICCQSKKKKKKKKINNNNQWLLHRLPKPNILLFANV